MSFDGITAGQLVGWASGLVLLLTILSQLGTQWRARSNEGVSPVLFVGQLLASTGFLVYAALQGDPVFIAVNVLLGLSAIVGLGIVVRNRRAGSSAPDCQ